MVTTLPQLHATTNPDGEDWMIFNHHVVAIARLLMVTRYTLLAEAESKLKSVLLKNRDIVSSDILKYGALMENRKISNLLIHNSMDIISIPSFTLLIRISA